MALDPLYTRHERQFQTFRFVYPVLSRRSGGISVGINLNPDKICNFDCIYCQVDRVAHGETTFVDVDQLLSELEATLDLVGSGALFAGGKFATTPPDLRELRDIAFSGDGEPTTFRNFESIVEACAAVKRCRGLNGVKLLLITNASMFHRPGVERALRILGDNQGEIWAKLDAGTESYYRLVSRAKIPLDRILSNITSAAQKRALVIQTLLMTINGQPPPDSEITALCDRLNEITAAGGRLQAVQICTVARPPAESFVGPLENSRVDAICRQVHACTGIPALAYYGNA